jgi:RNA polymerase sigma-70 factor (ECF subfamily)
MGSFKYNQDIVDDLVQDLFIKVSENIDKYSSSYTFNSWITRVAKNHMLDYIRKGKLETISYDNETTGDDGESISFQPEDKTSLNGEEILLKKERIAAVTAALATLDEKTRSVVTKRYFEGLSYEEIAQEENIKESQVKILLFRAKAKMNSMLVENKYLLATCID